MSKFKMLSFFSRKSYELSFSEIFCLILIRSFPGTFCCAEFVYKDYHPHHIAIIFFNGTKSSWICVFFLRATAFDSVFTVSKFPGGEVRARKILLFTNNVLFYKNAVKKIAHFGTFFFATGYYVFIFWNILWFLRYISMCYFWKYRVP